MTLIRRKRVFMSCLLGGLLVAMTLLAYIPAMQGGFIWDDDHYVTGNHTLKTLDGLRKIWLQPGATAQYYPMVFTSFWAQYQFWGFQPFAYHFANVLLHALNAVLVWLVVRRLHVPGAWMAAAIFALHPVHLESVAWITERKNVLSGFFYLSSLLVYLRFSLSDNQRLNVSSEFNPNYHLSGISGRRIGLYLFAIGLFSCALLSKSVTCSMPAVILLLLWWKRDQVSWRDVRALIPLFLLGLLYAAATIWIEKYYVGAQGEEWAFTIVDRFLIAGRALWFYVGKLVLPFNLSFIYPRWQIDSGIWWQYLSPLGAAAVVFSLWFIQKRMGKGPLVAVVVFGGTLLPALGFIDFYPMRYSFVADHFQYLASIAFIVLCVAFAKTVFDTIAPLAKPIEYGLSVAVLVMFGVLVWHGGHKYRDLETLWRDTMAKSPLCWMAHNNLGTILVERGDMAEAISHYNEALRIRPGYEEAHNNLGIALAAQGRLDEAVSHYTEALRIKPDFVRVHNNLGNALKKKGRTSQAIYHYKEALRLNPNFEEAHDNLGIALASQGKLDEAISHYTEALRIRPGSAETHHNLGLALANQGRITEAIFQFREALVIRPDYAEAQANLKTAVATHGKIEEAISKIHQALKLSPEDPALHHRLGNLYQRKGDLGEAIDQYEKALSIQPTHTETLSDLAMAYAIKGDYAKALSLFEKMVELRPDVAGTYYNIACIYARKNRPEDSVDWLKKAIERGYNNWDLIKTDKDLENLRRSSHYQAIMTIIESRLN